jgi:hypothetical protein
MFAVASPMAIAYKIEKKKQIGQDLAAKGRIFFSTVTIYDC